MKVGEGDKGGALDRKGEAELRGRKEAALVRGQKRKYCVCNCVLSVTL